MKKLFIAAVAALALTACGGGQTKDTVEGEEVSMEEIKEMAKEAGDAVQADPELKALMEKEDLTSEEKLTLLEKLKKIGVKVLTGEQTATEGASEAVDEVKAAGAEELKEAAAPAIEKVEEAKAAAEETKEKVENVKDAANALNDAVKGLKK
ncbi:MAG: hypothetical protein HUJ99_08790 [Bacteroidaceae bacterium]|nr:hypothetical protein [Bacteroidaceae bacterium]